MDKKAIVLIICFIYFAVLIIAGIFLSARNRKTSDFLLAGRKLNLPFSVATLAAVQIGAGIIIGGSSNGSRMGIWPGMWYALGCGGGLILAGILVAGKLRQQDSFVPMDFNESRYGANKWVRIWAWLSNVPILLVILIYTTIGGMWGIEVVFGEQQLDFFGDLKENYEKHNQDYIGGMHNV